MKAAESAPAIPRNWTFWAVAIVILLSCFRLAHLHLLWSDEDYHLAAAIQILAGKIPYRDFWYDKPPLAALFYLLIDAHTGWLLRLVGTIYILVSCFAIYRLARELWGHREGLLAALLLAFFTTFYLPSTVVPFASDAIILLPHIAAIYCMTLRKPLWAGVCCGLSLLGSAKGLFVFAACLCWMPSAWLPLCLGMALFTGAASAIFAALGAWPAYVEQVWRLGLLYASGTPEAAPFRNGVFRTLNWSGFHAVLILGSLFCVLRENWTLRRRLVSWIALSFIAVAVGSRFSPHYFLQLLPAVVIAASHGIVICFRLRPRLTVAAASLLLAIPLVRFGPRYATLAADDLRGQTPSWADIAMDLDSQRVARVINARKKPGDTLFVWGYRPNIYVYTRLTSDSLFWDSQPLTGVPADRHLHQISTIYSGPAVKNRQIFLQTRPTWFVDGLGLLNPKLRPELYPELHPWLKHYVLVDRTGLSLIYHRSD